MPIRSVADAVLCVCDSLKVEVLEVEMHLHNAGRFDPGAQYILLSGRVVAGAKTIQVVKETDTTHIITAASTTDFSAFIDRFIRHQLAFLIIAVDVYLPQ